MTVGNDSLAYLVEDAMLNHDRRAYPRKRVSLRLEGRSNSGAINMASTERFQLNVDDLSLGGLSAVVEQPIAGGSRLAVFFPPQHACQGALASGRVIRCEPRDSGYHIRVEFDRFPSVRGRMPYSDRALSIECA
jgi:hypothetical protein